VSFALTWLRQRRACWHRRRASRPRHGAHNEHGREPDSPVRRRRSCARAEIEHDGWDPAFVEEIERAGAQVQIDAGSGRRAETLIDRQLAQAIAHGIRCCVSEPVIVNGRPLRP
jgi:hypothetical protein